MLDPQTFRGTPGFFRLARAATGHWTLLDPHDRPFFLAAANHISALPGQDPLDFQHHAIRQLRACGLNTLGLGSDPALLSQGFPYLLALDLHSGAPHIHSGDAHLPDVFDPLWIQHLRAATERQCLPHRHHSELIGYFTDDAPRWAQPPAHDKKHPPRPTLLQLCLSLEPQARAYHAAWEFVLAPRRGDLARLARDWQIALPHKENLRQLTAAETPLTSDAYLRDQRRFTHEFARRYYAGIASALRAADPHHLHLGHRLDHHPGNTILAECAYPHLDALSLHTLHEPPDKLLQTLATATDLPLLLDSFNWTAPHYQKPPANPLRRPRTPLETMLVRGRQTLRHLCAHPAVIGYAWSDWNDRDGDAAPFAHGLMRADMHPAREHTDLLQEINRAIPSLRPAIFEPLQKRFEM